MKITLPKTAKQLRHMFAMAERQATSARTPTVKQLMASRLAPLRGRYARPTAQELRAAARVVALEEIHQRLEEDAICRRETLLEGDPSGPQDLAVLVEPGSDTYLWVLENVALQVKLLVATLKHKGV